MPYVLQEDRAALLSGEKVPTVAGELNFLFTEIAIKYLEENGRNYQHINDIVGALEGAKLELYRRVAAGYEDTKVASNGDVYPKTLISNS